MGWVTNAPTTAGQHEYWNGFDTGATVAAGDVYVICHPSADAAIQAECDETHTYLSNARSQRYRTLKKRYSDEQPELDPLDAVRAVAKKKFGV